MTAAGPFETEHYRRLRVVLRDRTGRRDIPDDATLTVRTGGVVADYGDQGDAEAEARITVSAKWGGLEYAETVYEGEGAAVDLIRDLDVLPEVDLVVTPDPELMARLRMRADPDIAAALGSEHEDTDAVVEIFVLRDQHHRSTPADVFPGLRLSLDSWGSLRITVDRDRFRGWVLTGKDPGE